jgi:hypothetical protein
MFVHIGFWKLKESASGKPAQENALEMRRRFQALKGVIAFVKTVVAERRVIDYDI